MGPAELRGLVDYLGVRLTPILAAIDPPAEDDGAWFMDVRLNRRNVTCSFRRGEGFGVYDAGTPLGAPPSRTYADVEGAANRILELAGVSP